jgi:hypothetical protein
VAFGHFRNAFDEGDGYFGGLEVLKGASRPEIFCREVEKRLKGPAVAANQL